MQGPKFWHRKEFSRGTQNELERSNSIDKALGLLKWNASSKKWVGARPRPYIIDFLIIGERDVTTDFACSLRTEQIQKLGLEPDDFDDGPKIDQPTPTNDSDSSIAQNFEFRRINAQLASELVQSIFHEPYACTTFNDVKQSDSLDVIAYSYALSSIVSSSRPRINPEDVVASSAADFAQHRHSTQGVITVSAPHSRPEADGHTIIYKLHILGNIDPTHWQIRKCFRDSQHAIFILDLAKLEETDSLTGVPYLAAQLDLFARCMQPWTSFTYRNLTMILVMVNADSLKTRLSQNGMTASSYLSLVCATYHTDDAIIYTNTSPDYHVVVKYILHLFNTTRDPNDDPYVSLYPHILSRMFDQQNIGFFMGMISDILFPQPLTCTCF